MRPAQKVFVRRVVCGPGPRPPAQAEGQSLPGCAPPQAVSTRMRTGFLLTQERRLRMPFPRTPTGLQDSCVTLPASPLRKQGSRVLLDSCLRGRTLENAVSSHADRPAGFLCDPACVTPAQAGVQSPAGFLLTQERRLRMPFPRTPTGLQDSCVTPACVTPAQAGVQSPAGFLLTQERRLRMPFPHTPTGLQDSCVTLPASPLRKQGSRVLLDSCLRRKDV